MPKNLRWYAVLYTRYIPGVVELVDYTEHSSLESAKLAVKDAKVEFPSDFWQVENEHSLGKLDQSAKSVFVKRERYSGNVKTAISQAKAEERARKVLRSIRALKPNATVERIQGLMLEVLVLKKYLSADQYKTVLSELERQPAIKRMLYKGKGN